MLLLSMYFGKIQRAVEQYSQHQNETQNKNKEFIEKYWNVKWLYIILKIKFCLLHFYNWISICFLKKCVYFKSQNNFYTAFNYASMFVFYHKFNYHTVQMYVRNIAMDFLSDNPSSPVYLPSFTDRQLKTLFLNINNMSVKEVTPIVTKIDKLLSFFRNNTNQAVDSSIVTDQIQSNATIEETQSLLVNTKKNLPNLNANSFVASVNYLTKFRNKPFEYGITQDSFFYWKLLSRKIVPNNAISRLELNFVNFVEKEIVAQCDDNGTSLQYCDNYSHLYFGGSTSNMLQVKSLLKKNDLKLFGVSVEEMNENCNIDYKHLQKDTQIVKCMYQGFVTPHQKFDSISCFLLLNRIAFVDFYIEYICDLLFDDGLFIVYEWNMTKAETESTLIDIFTIINKCKNMYCKLSETEQKDETFCIEEIHKIMQNHMSFCRSEQNWIDLITSNGQLELIKTEQNISYNDICPISILTFKKKNQLLLLTNDELDDNLYEYDEIDEDDDRERK